MSAERTTSSACTVCTTSTPSSSSISKVHLGPRVVLSLTKDTAMALEALLSHATAKPGRLRDPVWARTASKEPTRVATSSRRLNLGMMIPGTMAGMMTEGEMPDGCFANRMFDHVNDLTISNLTQRPRAVPLSEQPTGTSPPHWLFPLVKLPIRRRPHILPPAPAPLPIQTRIPPRVPQSRKWV